MSLLNNIIKPLCDRGSLLIVCLLLCSSAVAQDSYVSFKYANRHYFPLANFVTSIDYQAPTIISSIEDIPVFFMLESIDKSWNQRRFKHYNKISTIK